MHAILGGDWWICPPKKLEFRDFYVIFIFGCFGEVLLFNNKSPQVNTTVALHDPTVHSCSNSV